MFKIEVMLDVSWVLSTVPAGEQLTFEVWTGQNPLLPGEEPDNPDQITSINTVKLERVTEPSSIRLQNTKKSCVCVLLMHILIGKLLIIMNVCLK